MVEENLVAMVSNVNINSAKFRWWLDFGAIVHICKDKSMFTEFEENPNVTEMQMGNNTCAKVVRKSNVEIDFTSKKS